MAITKTNSLTIVSKDSTTNTAVVRYIVDLTTTGQTWWNYDVKCKYTIDGVSGENANYTRLPLNSTIRVLDVQQTIYNASGKTVNASFSYYTGTSAGTVTGSASVYIDLPLKANITDAPNFNDEQNPTISYSNPAGNAVNSLQACISLTGEAADINYRDISKTGTSYTFNLTDEERTVLRNATASNSRTVIFYLRTVIGENTYYSTISKTLTIINANPIFENFTYKDTNTLVNNIVGSNQVLVKGISNLQVTISSENKMAAQKGSSAKNYIATIDNKTISRNYTEADLTIDIGTINSSGTKRLNIRAFDSRNNSNSTEVYKDIMVYDYTKPIINAEVARLNNFESETTLKIDGTYSRLIIDDIDKNTIEELQYRYRETGKEWGEWLTSTVTATNGKFSCNDIILNLDNEKSFEIEVQVIDKLQTSTITLNVDVGQAIFFISSNEKACYINGKKILMHNVVDEWKSNKSVGFEEEHTYIDSKSVSHNRQILADILHPVGELYLTTDNNFNPNITWGGTWEKLSHDAYLKIVTNNAGETTGTTSNHTIPLSSIPAHDGHILNWKDWGSKTYYMPLYNVVEYGTNRPYHVEAGNEALLNTYNQGENKPYYPYYYGIIAWHRIS